MSFSSVIIGIHIKTQAVYNRVQLTAIDRISTSISNTAGSYIG